jgi:hypothetical protein
MSSQHEQVDRDMALEHIRSMRIQEGKSYRIPTEHLESIVMSCEIEFDEEKKDDACSTMSRSNLSTYLGWRSQMVVWCYSIAETCKFQKETVEIAMSMVDCYVAVRTQQLFEDAFAYQLSCMVCLYIAAKTHEAQCLTPKQLESLSSGRFSAQQIEAMEIRVLSDIQWRVNPPTASAFCRHLLDLVPLHLVRSDKRQKVLDIAESQIELALADESFIPVKASSIAVAALINALQCVVLPSQIGSNKWLSSYWFAFSIALGVDRETFLPKLDKMRKSLQSLVVYNIDSSVVHEESSTSKTMSQQEAATSSRKQESPCQSGSPRSVDFYQ